MSAATDASATTKSALSVLAPSWHPDVVIKSAPLGERGATMEKLIVPERSFYRVPFLRVDFCIDDALIFRFPESGERVSALDLADDSLEATHGCITNEMIRFGMIEIPLCPHSFGVFLAEMAFCRKELSIAQRRHHLANVLMVEFGAHPHLFRAVVMSYVLTSAMMFNTCDLNLIELKASAVQRRGEEVKLYAPGESVMYVGSSPFDREITFPLLGEFSLTRDLLQDVFAGVLGRKEISRLLATLEADGCIDTWINAKHLFASLAGFLYGRGASEDLRKRASLVCALLPGMLHPGLAADGLLCFYFEKRGVILGRVIK